jgi:dienelactone hydrolase
MLRILLGPHDPPELWETIRERSIEIEGHRRDELLLRAQGHRDLPVHLLTPRGNRAGRRPGVLALHGHGPLGHDAVAGIATTPEQRQTIDEVNYDYGLQLARRGYVVAAPCFTPFGRRLDDAKAYGGDDPCAVTFVRMQLLGRLLISENLRDALWALALLRAQPGVDPDRIGCVGLSYGGRMTMLATALSPHIRVAVVSGALNVMQERIRGRYSCGAQVVPSLLKYGDVPEIASRIAPRPCLWEAGTKDELLPKDRIEPALERMRRAWRALDASGKLEVDFFDGGHRWNGTRAYALLAETLQMEEGQ